jgi:DNA repair protein RadC
MQHFDPIARQTATRRPAQQPSNPLVERIWNHGTGTLTDAELLAVLLRSGTGGQPCMRLAAEILERSKRCLLDLFRRTPQELVAVPGLGRAQTAILMAAMELGRRRGTIDPRNRPLVATSASAYEILRSVLEDLPHEEFWLLLLDRGNRLLERVPISVGGLHGTVADPKMIFKKALDRRASGLVLAHNHPSGQLRPSEEDIRLTRKLVDGSRLLDLAVQDHLIVVQSGYFSFADNAMMG